MILQLVRTLRGLAYDITVGLVKEYKRTTLDLAKIEIATLYVKAIKLIRQECMISVMIVFGAIIFANVLGVLQTAILLFAPWNVGWRIVAALGLGLLAFCLPLAVVLQLFSQRRWMEITKADDLLARTVETAGAGPEAGQNDAS